MSRRSAASLPKTVAAGVIVAALTACSANSGPSTELTAPLPHPVATAAPVVKFALAPAAVKQGQSVIAKWSTTGATSCAAVGAWSGSKPLSNATGATLGPLDTAGTYMYGMTCTGPGGKTAVSQALTVGAVPAPTIQFAVTPLAVAPGNHVAITWSTTNATACTASGGTGSDGWNGTQPTADSTGFDTGAITAAGDYPYSLTCTGVGGTTEQDSIVTVDAAAPPPPPSITFSAQPSVIQPGQTTSFSWNSSNATQCTAGGGSGADGWTGVEPTSSSGTTVGPVAAGTYSYTLTCTGPGGSFAKSVPVAVNAAQQAAVPTLSLDVTPSQIVAGGSAALSWSSTDADTCTASGSWSGSEPVQGSAVGTGTLTVPAVYTYTLTCAGIGGTTNDAAQLSVVPAPASITHFTATPSSIAAGQSTVLAWTSGGDATSCAATGGSGADNWGGAVSTSSSGTSVGPIDTAGNYVYTLTCIGPGGLSAPQSVSVTVTPATLAPAGVSNLAASPSTILAGQAALLTWGSNSATSCTATGGTGADNWHGSVGTTSAGTSTGPIANPGSYQYTLTCTGPGGMGSPSSVFVNVASATPGAASVATFDATPSTIQVGQSTSLAWTSANAASCAATNGSGSDGWSGAVATSSAGTPVGPLNVPGSITYTLTCTGSGGVGAPSSLVVNVTTAPPPAAAVTSFTATPSSLLTGQTTSLAWSSSNATGCAATGGSGADTWSGAVSTSSTGTSIGPLNTPGNYTYTLTCTGPGGTGSASSVAVNVTSTPPAPTIGSFTATPTAVQTGGSTTLAWSSNDATACAATGGSGGDGWSGSQPTSSTGFSVGPISTPGTVTYTLTCTNSGGASAPSSASVAVTTAPPPATIANFAATPSAVQSGQASELSWTSSNATSCAATGGTGSDGWNGTVPTSSTGRSTGAITTPNTYTYTLTCTGAGGSSAPSNATVSVTNATPPASIATFTAAPATLQTGQSTQLAWTTSGASACTASGGDGTDGWNGTKAVSSTGTSVGPLNTAGNYIYTLTCTGPGGASAPSSLGVTVDSAPAPAAITSFTATPSSVQAGQSTALAWTTTGATSCTATGGTGSDGWSGSMAASNSGVAVGPLTSAGSVTYTLTCTGAGGAGPPASTHVNVAAAVPGQPTVALLANGADPATVQPGASPMLSWSSTNAASCTASGGTGADGWSGSKPTSSSGLAIGPLLTPGIYSYTLTCSGTGGSGSSTVQITVVSSNSTNCGASTPTASLVSPAASTSTSIYNGPLGLQCLGCTIGNPANVIDASTTNYASMAIPVGLLGGSATLDVTDNAATFPAGRQAGFVISQGTSPLSLSALSDLTVKTLLNGTVQDTATGTSLLTLQALGALSVNQYAGYLSFTTTKPFNSVELVASSLATALTNYQVYDACVSLQ